MQIIYDNICNYMNVQWSNIDQSYYSRRMWSFHKDFIFYMQLIRNPAIEKMKRKNPDIYVIYIIYFDTV